MIYNGRRETDVKQDLIAFIWPALVGVLGAALILDRWVLPDAEGGKAL
jgi:hypothetical protein